MRSIFKLRLLLLALIFGASFVIALPTHAQQKFPSYNGLVNDFANVIDPATEQHLETILTNFDKLTGAQIAAVIVPSLEGRPIEDYALDLYRAWGIGAKSGENKNKGALLLVALQDRKTRLEIGYGLEGDIPDGLAGEIIRRMRPYLQQQQYSQAMTLGVRTIVDTLAEKWNVSLADIEDRRYAYRGPQPQQVGGAGLGMIFFALIFFFIVMSIVARSSRRRVARSGAGESLWWLAPLIFNRGAGGFGGGSWGSGGDSGGNSDSGWSSGGGSDWGGFGGGSTGGGGASDSW